MRRARLTRWVRIGLWSACLLLAGHAGARAAPDAYLPAGDPLEAELRILDLTDPGADPGRILLPHLHTRPLRWRELEGAGAPAEPGPPARALALARIERALGRHASPVFAPHPALRSTPFAWRSATATQGFELSLAAEGRGTIDRNDSRFETGTGAHARVTASFDRWLVHSHLLLGQVDEARSFADPLFADGDIILHTEDTYVACTGRAGDWGARLGRSRWHWGPGEEASLTLSKTSPAFTGVSMAARLAPLRADLIVLSGTLAETAGERLAAHRLEWRPAPRLRLGVTETARYHGSGWRPLYLAGVIPYILVQRLEQQDEPDSLAALRNNIMLSVDLAWRPIAGTRLYGELLIDDLHAKTSANPDKIGVQLGLEGVGTVGSARLSWGAELTRLSRYVYTSYFGRAYESHGRPIGFPTGPDARRLSVRGAWDPGADWQIGARLARTDKGENDLDEPYVPGAPRPRPFSFEGVVEREESAEIGLRWWPASGVDLAVWAGARRVGNAGHVAGDERETPTAALELRLAR